MVSANVPQLTWNAHSGSTAKNERTLHFTAQQLLAAAGQHNRSNDAVARATLQAQLATLQTDLDHSNAQVLQLTEQLAASSRLKPTTMEASKDFETITFKQHTPSLHASTYVVPTRRRSTKIDQFTTSIPFYILSILFGVSLAVAVAVASPSLSTWLAIAPFLLLLVRGLFVVVAASTVISFMLEFLNTQKTV